MNFVLTMKILEEHLITKHTFRGESSRSSHSVRPTRKDDLLKGKNCKNYAPN